MSVQRTDTSETGAVTQQPVPGLYGTDNILERLLVVGAEEVTAPLPALFFSGLAAGLAITLSFLGIAVFCESFGVEPVFGALMYPLGFAFIVLGRYQLFTENTLTPVLLVLTRTSSVPTLLRVWGVVLFANLLGAVLGGLGLATTGVLSDEVAHVAVELAEHQMGHGFWPAFAKAIVAGWLVAGMTWIAGAVRDSTARLIVVWIFFYAVGAFDLVHCIAGTAEAAYAWWAGSVTVWQAVSGFLVPAVVGNTVGGVVLVALLNFAQARDRWFAPVQLSWRQMLFTLQTPDERHPVHEARDDANPW